MPPARRSARSSCSRRKRPNERREVESMKKQLYIAGCTAIAALRVVCAGRLGPNASWIALASGLAISLATRMERPKQAKLLTTLSLQLGVMALGAGMNLETVLRVGVNGAIVTAT